MALTATSKPHYEGTLRANHQKLIYLLFPAFSICHWILQTPENLLGRRWAIRVWGLSHWASLQGLFYIVRKHKQRVWISALTLLWECLSWVCSERYSKTLLKPVKCLIATSEARLSPPHCVRMFVQMMHGSSAKQKEEHT